MKSSALKDKPLYALVFVSSMLISALVYWQYEIINRDGILYVSVAQQFIENGLGAARAAFNWPFYAILIGLTHQLTSLSYEAAAHLLNAVLTALMCTAFVAVYAEIQQKRTRPWFAAILILSLPLINDYRDFIIRDFGFWAFSLLALLYFIRFARSPGLASSVLWQISALTATAFRIEGIAFFVAPLILYLFGPAPRAQNLANIWKASFLLVATVFAGALAAVLSGVLSHPHKGNTLSHWLSYLSPLSIVDRFQAQSLALKQQMGYLSSDSEAMLILGAGLLVLALFKVFVNASVPVVAVAAYGIHQRWLHFSEASRIVTLFLSLSFLTLLVFAVNSHFVSSRYTVTTVLFLSLITFQYVDIAFQRLSARPKRRWMIIGFAIILALFLDGVISTKSTKADLKASALWALNNIDRERPWLCNEARLRFYTDDHCTFVRPDRLLSAIQEARTEPTPGYLVLWIGRKDESAKQVINENPWIRLVHSSSNRKGDQVAIFETDQLPDIPPL